jgi:hypothetical protein
VASPAAAGRAPQQRVVEPCAPGARAVGGAAPEGDVLQVEERRAGDRHEPRRPPAARQLGQVARREHAVEHRRDEQRHQRHPQWRRPATAAARRPRPAAVGPQQRRRGALRSCRGSGVGVSARRRATSRSAAPGAGIVASSRARRRARSVGIVEQGGQPRGDPVGVDHPLTSSIRASPENWFGSDTG